MPAVNAVLGGKHFVSASLSGNNLAEATHLQTGAHPQRNNVVIFTPPQTRTRSHDVIFYSSDRDFLDGVTRFIGAALKAGDAAIVVATDSHRDKLLPRLHAYGGDMDAAIKRGRYITVDADTISSFVVNGTLDTGRFLDTFCNLILVAAKAAEREHPRVVIFGEGAHLLWAQGNVEAAIEDERLCNQLVKMYDGDILCGYGLNVLPGGIERQIYRQICEEHSVVYSR